MNPFRKVIPNIFLIIAIGFLLLPSFYYWVYPYPAKIKLQRATLEKTHMERVAHIKNAIKKNSGGARRSYGGAEPWRDSERAVLLWQEKLIQENQRYSNQIDAINKFPWTNAFVLFGILLASFKLHLAIRKARS